MPDVASSLKFDCNRPFAKMTESHHASLNKQLWEQLRTALGLVPEGKLRDFNQQLFPCEGCSDIFEAILKNMTLRVEAGSSRAASSLDIATDILSKCAGTQLEEPLVRLFESGFLNRVKTRSVVINLQSPRTLKENHRANEGRPEKKSLWVGTKRKDQKLNSLCKGISLTKSAASVEKVQKIIQGDCHCGTMVSPMEDDTFRCVHCVRFIHISCVKKNLESPGQCLICHMKLLIPNKPSVKQLFAGVLKKGKRRHQFSFTVDDQDLKSGLNVQIRCFRIKETTNSFLLFPDAATIEINGSLIRQFMPLHKQSSLKYRKDEPVTLHHSELRKEMNVVITEDREKSKDERIQLEDHLIGFYLVEDLSCSQLCKQFQETSLTTSKQSLKLLNSVWSQQGNIQELSLEMIKIPLVCALSSQRIKLPVRGIYCRHYQCFDLHSYVYMVAQTSNPRWVCPLCRQPAYQVRLDRILLAILVEHTSVQNLSEVLFFRNGQYSIAGEKDRRNIGSLCVENLRKRQRQLYAEREDDGGNGRRLGRKEVVISLL